MIAHCLDLQRLFRKILRYGVSYTVCSKEPQWLPVNPWQDIILLFLEIFYHFWSFLSLSAKESTFSFFLVDNSSLVPLGLIYIISPPKIHFLSSFFAHI